MTADGRSLTRIAAVAVAAIVALTGCGGGESAGDARPVTTEESQLLAIARFQNFDAGTRSVAVAFDDNGFSLTLRGYMDYRSRIGYGALVDGGVPNSLVMWRQHDAYVHAPAGDAAPLPPPDLHASAADSWAGGPLNPTASTLHAVLILITELGNDRPDNPLLLQQGGAQWLRTDQIDGVDVTVFAGPTTTDAGGEQQESRLRYWVAADGTMLRVEALLGIQWVTLDFGAADGITLDALPAAAAEHTA